MTMYFVGIDISKYKHDCCIISAANQKVVSKFTFKNDKSGFEQLNLILNSLSTPEDIKIGFESTAHYALNLELFLENSLLTFMEVNPVLISEYKKSKTLRRTKTDSVDCESIARWLMTVEYKPHSKGFYHAYSLKSLTRLRDKLIRQRSFYLIKITNVLDHTFPEFKPFFGSRFSVTALYILSNYSSPEKIANMNSKSYEALRKLSRGRFSTVDFAKLKQLAKNTIGTTEDYLLLQMQIVLDIYRQLDSKVDETEVSIKECVSDMNPPMLSVPGIGIESAAVILAEFGDFSKFKNASQMLSFAGLEPGYFQSGTSETTGKMVKHGSSYLRYALMNCAQTVVNYEPTFAMFYSKKRAEGKPHRVALSHVVKKLLRVIYTLQTKSIAYDADFVR